MADEKFVPAGGLVAYVHRVRAEHRRLANGECSCGSPLCVERFLLDHIDDLLNAYQLKVQDFARETARSSSSDAPNRTEEVAGRWYSVGYVETLRDELKRLATNWQAATAESDAIRDALDGLILDVDCEQPDGTTPSADMSLPDYIAAVRQRNGLLPLVDEVDEWSKVVREQGAEIQGLQAELVTVRAQRDDLRAEVYSWIKSTIRADGEAYAAQQKLNDLYKALGEQKLWELGIQPPRDGQPDTCPHGDTNCKTVLGKTVLDKPYHGNCHPWHYHLRSRLNGVYGALVGQGNELAPELRAAIGFLDESVGPDTEATGRDALNTADTERMTAMLEAGTVPPGRYRLLADIHVDADRHMTHGQIQGGVKIAGLYNVGPVVLRPLAEMREFAEQPVTPATPTGVAVVELDADDPLAQRVEHDSRMDGVDTPGCDCGHSGMAEGWHSSDCTWKQTPAAPTLRACSQDEGCTGISCDLPARHPDSHEGKATYEQAKYVGYQLTVIWPRMPYDKCKPPLTEVGDQAPGGES